MTTQQPEALWLATASNAMADEGEMIHLLSWHEIRNLLRANAAELRRQHARIAELEARIKTMAEEHADELMVAHLDGRMRAAQAAPQQEAQEPVAWYVTGCGRLLDEDEAKAEARRIGGTARAIPLYTAPQADSQPASTYSIDADTQGIRARVADAITGALAFGAQGAQPPPTGHWLAPFWEMAREEVIRASRAPADSVLEDAARLDWLLLHISGAEFRRIGVHYSGNASRADVDAARKQGANHD